MKVDMTFCAVTDTPVGFDEAKFHSGDEAQQKLYKDSKTVNQKKKLTFEQVTDPVKKPNYARVVPSDCVFIDFDDPESAEAMKNIILRAKLNCLILKTTHGYHFLFRRPDFYKKEVTGATNWFGLKFDCKANTKDKSAVQIMRACGMDRPEIASWTGEEVNVKALDTDRLDVLPYWLWGHKDDKGLFKDGFTKTEHYTIEDNPFTKLRTMSDGGRHDHIFSRCSYFAAANGFTLDDFKSFIRGMHDEFLAKIGTPMSDTDLFSDLDKRWDEYIHTLEKDYTYDKDARIWIKADKAPKEKIDERRAAEYLYTKYDFYVKNAKANGVYSNLLFRYLDGDYEYLEDLTKIRGGLRTYSDQNFKMLYFEEVEAQLMQICSENHKLIKRSHQYVLTKNKVLSCVLPDAYDFEWLGKRPPTDVVFRWNWQPPEWVEEHEEDLGGIIKKFMKELSRNAAGVPDPMVEQWLWVIAGAAMIPSNSIEKIIVLAGGGGNGKSVYTSLIRLCLGEDMFNMSKIFDSSPQDSFWGADLDKGICCIVDDMPRLYNKDAFSYIKGAITKTDTVVINEKFKPKRTLTDLPMIISCTNSEFELYDKSEGMRRRVLILPTECEIPRELRDRDMEYKLVLNTIDPVAIAEYKMGDNFDGEDCGTLVMHMYTKEKGVLQSLDNGSLCWFANKCRYDYFKWLTKEIILDESDSMKERLDITFSGGFEGEACDFLEWYLTEHTKGIWTRDLYLAYAEWHTETGSGELLMKEKSFSLNLGKAIAKCKEKGFKVAMKKRKNDKGMSLNYLLIGDEVDE